MFKWVVNITIKILIIDYNFTPLFFYYWGLRKVKFWTNKSDNVFRLVPSFKTDFKLLRINIERKEKKTI